ncbi:ABC transporter permease [Desulfosarcina ovata]|uniref:ABC transporter permease n=2 Tax=Desulfosarcina ovata TaxID=83564 RepID=A0A5K8A5X1_9BACT|nr:ABC transporter permease [Desulfosarcina ovata]BBO80657.1 ABC transporter permease [Desulfosarcina ovata subsp. sediminis]BBO87869.1 ABC transporter permease [Desulfosarcina ovata subsp. ovata]
MTLGHGKRFLEYLFTVWVIVTLNFALPRTMPGDPFLYLSADEGDEVARFSQAQQDYYQRQYGLDRPLAVQYGTYLCSLARGDMGYSIYYNQDVSRILFQRLPWTLLLVSLAVGLSSLAGCLLGSLSAYHRGRFVDRWLFPAIVAFSEIPAFLLGLVLLFTLAAGLQWFPLSGAMTHFATFEGMMGKILDIARHAALPVLTLTLVRTGGMTLLARNSMTTVLARDYVRTARAKGLHPLRILTRHTLRNAMLPIVTRIFLSLGGLVGGAILVENVFAYPGLGRLMRDAVLVHDYPMIQGIFLLVTVSVLSANFAADLVYRRLDPRIQHLESLRS